MKKRLNFETSLINYSETNSGFAKVKISIMTHEQVANGTHFKKDVIDNRKKNLNYLPVIGQFKKEDEDFGTHGEKIEITDDDFKIITRDDVDSLKVYTMDEILPEGFRL